MKEGCLPMRYAAKSGPGFSMSLFTSLIKSQVLVAAESHGDVHTPQHSYLFPPAKHTNVAFHTMLMQNLSFPENVDRENNKDYNQVLLDVQRSLRRFPPGELIPVQSSVFVKSVP